MNSRMVRSVSLVSSCLVLALTVATAPAHADDPPPNGDLAAPLEPLGCSSLAPSTESEVNDIKLNIVDGRLNVTGALTFPTPVSGAVGESTASSVGADADGSRSTTSLAGVGFATRARPIQPVQPIVVERTGRVEWTIDPNTCTYTLKRAPTSGEFTTELDKAALTRQGARNPTTQYFSYNRAGFRVVTKDPAKIYLATTQVVGFWASDGLYAYNNGSYMNCWSANPTALGTHWYTSYCSGTNAWQSNPSTLCYNGSGNYYNYDGPPLGSPYVRTDAMHYLDICVWGPYLAGVNFNFWYWGEGWWLLSGYLEYA